MNQGSRPTRYAWVVVALLFPVALLNYLDRQIFLTMKRSMMADVPSIATEEQFGALMGVFLIVYGLFSPIGGYFADRFNRCWTVIISLGVWSLVTWLGDKEFLPVTGESPHQRNAKCLRHFFLIARNRGVLHHSYIDWAEVYRGNVMC